jgi:uncharacterized membrane protein
MPENLHFPVFVVASLVVFIAILLFVTRKRAVRPPIAAVLGTAAIVVIGGMVFAKLGHTAGWPWWIYYTAPALATLVVPPVVLRFSPGELWRYLFLAALSSPLIHVLFSFFLGWHEYMPFIRVPSLHEILGATVGQVPQQMKGSGL